LCFGRVKSGPMGPWKSVGAEVEGLLSLRDIEGLLCMVGFSSTSSAIIEDVY